MMAEHPAVAERDALIDLIEGRKRWLPGNHRVTDQGFDFDSGCADLVYEINGWRYELTVRCLRCQEIYFHGTTEVCHENSLRGITDDRMIADLSDDQFEQYWSALGVAVRVACLALHPKDHPTAAIAPEPPEATGPPGMLHGSAVTGLGTAALTRDDIR